MRPATAPYLLRSLYKDDHIISTHLNRQITNIVTALFGAHTTNCYDAQLCYLAKGIYVAFALLRGQTLGQEFCDLLPVTGSNPPRLVGMRRKLLLATFLALEPAVVFQFAVRLFPRLPPHDVVSNVSKCTLMMLMLLETYGTLAHRFLRVRYLSLVPSGALQNGEGAPRTYLKLGFVLMLELLIRLWRAVAEWRGNRGAGEQNEQGGAAGRGEDDSDTADEHASVSGKCMLCLGNRKQPTATLCGHIFCWRCLSEWIKSNTQGAICPFCRRRITVNSLVPLYFYVAKEPPVADGDSGAS
ncbi:peroxisome assembly protein, putative [Trypanosoma equiperdum]|uniref:RING-type E3 ubiquitin transferase n=1 Tax=Trypanosoma equiperdum TaxID=5694 RepID=A0A1G4IEH4_TRYEQ|nr:peroxisome assembly protein, putative [Trypanosoma equiperdum]